MTRLLASAALLGTLTAATTTVATAEPQAYTIDPAHSEIVFSWSHAGFSQTSGVVFDLTGDLMFDEENPENSSVSVSIPVESLIVTPEFEGHLLESGDFFQAEPGPITFESTSINVTGDNTADIIGDLTLNGETNEVTINATLNQQGSGPMGDPVAGFTGTATIDRTQYNLGAFAPTIPADVSIDISLEASPASGGSQ